MSKGGQRIRRNADWSQHCGAPSPISVHAERGHGTLADVPSLPIPFHPDTVCVSVRGAERVGVQGGGKQSGYYSFNWRRVGGEGWGRGISHSVAGGAGRREDAVVKDDIQLWAFDVTTHTHILFLA